MKDETIADLSLWTGLLFFVPGFSFVAVISGVYGLLTIKKKEERRKCWVGTILGTAVLAIGYVLLNILSCCV